MKSFLALCLLALLPACQANESVAAYGAADRVWTLTELDGTPFTSRATLAFPKPGRIAGQAPCNRYFATQNVPYPWFQAGPIGATRMACPDLQAETQYFVALSEMTLSEVAGPTLILSNDAGRSMVFTAQE
jgi:heat shock protein HslJ